MLNHQVKRNIAQAFEETNFAIEFDGGTLTIVGENGAQCEFHTSTSFDDGVYLASDSNDFELNANDPEDLETLVLVVNTILMAA